MRMWTTEFDAGKLDDLSFSREVSVAVPAGKLVYASIALAGVTIAGTGRVAQGVDQGDPFVWARIMKAGGRDLATVTTAGYPAFHSCPTTWSGRVPDADPHLTFGVESHLAQATVVIQIVQTDDPLDVVVQWGEDVRQHPPLA
jgi:hypothetical protein